MIGEKIKQFSAVLLVVTLCTIALPAAAEDVSDLKKQQNIISSKIENIKKAVSEVNKEKKSILQELTELEHKLDQATRELNETEAKLRITRQNIAKTTAELNKAQAKVDEQKDTLSFRMRNLYKTGPVDYIEVLLDASSFSDFLTRLDLVKCVIEADKQLLAEFREKQDLVAKKKQELEAQQRLILQQQDRVRSRRASIASYRGDRQRLLTNLEGQKEEYERMQDQLEKDSASLRRKILEYESKNKKAFMGTGEFRWPVPSSTRITSEYGWRTHPVHKTRSFHNGIDIGASMGADVLASDDGEVIFAGWYGAYGNTVIVSHGGGISTQYSHLSKILVSQGKKVLKGDKVGLIGTTGVSTGPHLHFTIIVNGEPISPWNKLK